MKHAKHPLFPRKVGEQVADLNTKTTYLETNGSRLGIPPSELSTVRTQVEAVNTAQAAVDNRDTRTKLNTAVRNQVLRVAMKTVRKMIKYYVAGSPKATEVDYEALSIPRPGPHSPLEPPHSAPGIGRIVSDNLAVSVPYFDAVTGSPGRPSGVRSIEVCYQLGGDPPGNVSAMTGRKRATKSPLRIQFDFADEFQMLYIAFRWTGTRGDYGPWSEIHKIVIAR
jgi:hypothetical protein